MHRQHPTVIYIFKADFYDCSKNIQSKLPAQNCEQKYGTNLEQHSALMIQRSEKYEEISQQFTQGEIQTKINNLLRKIDKIRIQASNNQYSANSIQIVENQADKMIQELQKQQRKIIAETKNKINQKVISVDHQFQILFKKRKLLKAKYSKQIDNSIQQLKQLKEKSFKKLQKEKKIVFDQLKMQNKNIGKQVDKFVKQNQHKRKQILVNAETMRARLLNKLSAQESAREEMNAALHNLLQKTCEKAQRSLQRSIIS